MNPPIHITKINRKLYNLGYKVVTIDLRSLGLRRNPNIIQYKINRWFFLEEDQVIRDSKDYGGIWVARTLSNARNLQKYMREKHKTKTRIFKTALDEILYFNNYRVKTNGVKLFEEVCKINQP